jgi:predicted ATPase
MQKKVIITGGPSTGKSTIIEALQDKGYSCQEEISRELVLEARKEGIEQIFLTSPILFSEKLLEKRTEQYYDACKLDEEVVFFDRGILDILAYLDFAETPHNFEFKKVMDGLQIDQVFITPPWQEIHKTDNERYESFEEAKEIHKHLMNSYEKFGFQPVEIPIGAIEDRVSFILEQSK